MSIYLWSSEPSKIYVWSSEVSEVYVGTEKVRPDKMHWYQEVEYIQSDWVWCKINTWVTPYYTNFFELEFKINPTAFLVSQYNYFYASEYANNAWFTMEYTTNRSTYWNTWSSTFLCKLNPNLSTWNDYIFDCKYSWNNGGTLSISWTYTLSANYSWKTWTWPLYFFNSWWTWACSAEKLYYLRLYGWANESTKTLLRDFVPCYRKSDWEIWLYDLVNDVFYTNQDSWSFTKWPDVN